MFRFFNLNSFLEKKHQPKSDLSALRDDDGARMVPLILPARNTSDLVPLMRKSEYVFTNISVFVCGLYGV